jgi:hypothetical protein
MTTTKGTYDPAFVPISTVSTSGKNDTGAQYVDNIPEKDGIIELKQIPTRRMEIPEAIRNLSPEERLAAEKKLVRRIDFRLLPMLVLMYIMNYLVCKLYRSWQRSKADLSRIGITLLPRD